MKLFFLLITVVLFIGCSKEDKRIRYRIISQGTSEISYSMRGGPLKFETVTGDWSKSFQVVQVIHYTSARQKLRLLVA